MAVWDALSWAGVNDDPGTLPWTRLTSASAWASTQGGLDGYGTTCQAAARSGGPDRAAPRFAGPRASAERVPFSCGGRRHGRGAACDAPPARVRAGRA